MMSNTPNMSKVAYYAVNGIDNPCHGCQRRKAGCHSSCARHKVFLCRVRAEKKKIEDAYLPELRAEEHEIKSKQQTIKRQHHGRP